MRRSARLSTRELLDDLSSQRILLLDGSMGALIFAHEPTEEDYRGTRFRNHPELLKNCTEVLVLTQPQLIEEIHRAYLEAGADIIETDTFNANRLSLAEFGLEEHVVEMNQTAAEIARRAADDFTRRNPDKPRFVAGSIGPTNKTLSHRHARRRPRPPRRHLRRVGRHLLPSRSAAWSPAASISCCRRPSFDTLVLKACLFAIDKYFDETRRPPAGDVSGTIFENGRTLSAQTVEAFYVSVSHFDALSVGLNCAVGVDLMRPDVESAGRHLPQADQLLSQRRPARRLRRLHGRPRPHGRASSASSPATAGSTSSAAAAAPRRSGSPPSARPSRASPPRAVPDLPRLVVLQRHRAAGRPARDQLHHDRRAHQHHRLANVRPPDQGGQLRGGPGRGPRAGRGRRQHPRRQHGRGPDRRRGGDDALPQPARRRARHRHASRS